MSKVPIRGHLARSVSRPSAASRPAASRAGGIDPEPCRDPRGGRRRQPGRGQQVPVARREDRGRRPVGDDLAGAQHDDPPEVRGRELHVVGDRHDRSPGRAERLDDPADASDPVAVLPGRGLVEDQHRRIHRQDPGQRHSLRRDRSRSYGLVASSRTGRPRPGWRRRAGRYPPREGPGCAARTRPRDRPSARTAARRGSGTRTRRSGPARRPGDRRSASPSSSTRPSAGRSRPLRCLTSVVLPEPFWPRIATASPGSMVSDTPRTASTPVG